MTARRFFNWWLRLAYRLLLRLSVEGTEHVPPDGPVILIINHINFLDPFVVAASMPRQVTAMSKIENFSIPVFGWIFKLYGAIPVNRGEADRSALKMALAILKSDTMLLIAPEGTRSPTLALQKPLDGLAYLAYRSGAIIVPVALTGTPAFSRCIKRLRRTPVHLQVGIPFRFRSDSPRLTREQMTAMTNEAMYQLAALLPPEHRGLFSDLSRATTSHLEFVHPNGSNLPSQSKN
jgi:1-acyl-sn-glycerol-3-phosphate acyltransferase